MLRRALAILGCSLAFLTAHAQAFERPGAWFEQADANGDDLLTLEEFKNARAQSFPKRDRNSDGFIDESDMPKMASERPKARAAANFIMAELDSDGDGKISQSEFVAGAEPLFERADTNGDGVVDLKERDALRATVKERLHQRQSR